MPIDELSELPWKLQDIFRGKSPSLTMQLTWASAPAVDASSSNQKGVILGGAGEDKPRPNKIIFNKNKLNNKDEKKNDCRICLKIL